MLRLKKEAAEEEDEDIEPEVPAMVKRAMSMMRLRKRPASYFNLMDHLRSRRVPSMMRLKKGISQFRLKKSPAASGSGFETPCYLENGRCL